MTLTSGGVLIIDKKEGMTSAAVVSRMRVLLGEKRVGHTGTLDPFATGVLPICFGRATAAAHYMLHWNKRYLCDISLGMTTDTMDATGETLERTPDKALGRFLSDESRVESELEAVTRSFLGKRRQQVPIFSAVKVDGKRLYRYAREGRDVDLPEREIIVYEATYRGLSIDKATGTPIVSIEFLVSSGSYIRVLAEEYGRALGCFAHAQSLRRLAAGPLTVEQSVALDSLFDTFNALGRDPLRLRRHMVENGTILPLAAVFADWRRVMFDRENACNLVHGRRVALTEGYLLPPLCERTTYGGTEGYLLPPLCERTTYGGTEGYLLQPFCERTAYGDTELFSFCYGKQVIAIGFIEGEYYRVKRVFLEPDDIKSFEGIASADDVQRI